jgi:hypothetical protein
LLGHIPLTIFSAFGVISDEGVEARPSVSHVGRIAIEVQKFGVPSDKLKILIKNGYSLIKMFQPFQNMNGVCDFSWLPDHEVTSEKRDTGLMIGGAWRITK